MKKYLALALLLAIAVTAQSQINVLGQTTKKQESNFYVTSSLLFVSGMADGLAEACKYKTSGVLEVLPFDKQFIDPSVSWKNKWRNGDPAQGERFPLSSTALVGVTDMYHLSRTLRNVTMIAGVTIQIGESKKWYYHIFDSVIYYLSYTLGFTLSYDIIFDN